MICRGGPLNGTKLNAAGSRCRMLHGEYRRGQNQWLWFPDGDA